MRAALVLLLALTFTSDAFAKKDFKGLFGSYRREKFTENEGNNTDFGVDFLLSTLVPLTPIVSSSEDGSTFTNLNYATFFNLEASFFVTLSYNWELTFNAGYYTYSTRKQNTSIPDPTLNQSPLFEQFDMEAYPMLVGVKYRFSREDIVPYIGVAGGMAYVHRKGYYDYSNIVNEEYLTVPTGRVDVGVEFFFASRAGIRLEVSGDYLGLPEHSFDPGGIPQNNPKLNYKASPIAVRYASGIFFLF